MILEHKVVLNINASKHKLTREPEARPGYKSYPDSGRRKAENVTLMHYLNNSRSLSELVLLVVLANVWNDANGWELPRPNGIVNRQKGVASYITV